MMAAKVDPKMRALKLLVAAMGALLVLGTAALVWAVIYRVQHRPPAAVAKPAASTVVALPSGARVEGSDVAGDRVAVRLALPDGGHEILIFDLRNGARIATIELRSSGSPGDASR